MNQLELKYFVAAAESSSFTKTAEKYYITQAAVTQHIQALEESLGCSLFDRRTRPVRLTPAGKVFYAEAVGLLAQMESAVKNTKSTASGTEGSIRIGFLKGYERSNLSVFVRRFHRSHPGTFLTFDRQSSDKLASGLSEGRYDIIFTWDSTNLKTGGKADWLEMERARLVAALYAGHPLATRLSLTRKDFAGENILYMSPSDDFDSFGDASFLSLYKDAGYRPKIIARTSDAETVLMMVAAEEGISILPDYVTNKLSGSDNLIFIPIEGENEYEQVDAIWQKDHTNPALSTFVQQLKEEERSR